MSNTEFADVKFKADDNEGTTQYVGTQENGPDTNAILHGQLNFRLQLKPGVTFEQAKEVANYLNKYVSKLSVTSL